MSRRTPSQPRAFRAWLATVIAAASLGCSNHPSKPPAPDPFVPYKWAVDQWPTWSQDRRSIAFHRVLPSSDGPPGVYVVPFSGGKPRLVVAGDFFYPRHLSFSPDNSKLVCDWGQVTIIDVATGSRSTPFYTENGTSFPAWAPDGRLIAHTRYLRKWYEPYDSVGIHLYSLDPGLDHVLKSEGEMVNGNWAHWSSDGSLFAYIGNHPSGKTAAYVMTPDSVHHVVAIATGWWFERLQWIRPTAGDDRLLIQELRLDKTLGGLVVKSDGTPIGPWPLPMSYFDAASSDGRWAVLVRGQIQDSMGVLFVQDTDSRRAPRQLTSWSPQPGSALAGRRESR